jgi:hypothetical protein
MPKPRGFVLVCVIALVVAFILVGNNMNWFRNVTKEERFWNWFVKNEDAIFHFESNQEQVFDNLSASLKSVDKDLTFEFGPVESGQREFVISAGGIRSCFPSVIALAGKAPPLSRWKIVQFRPRRDQLNDLEYGGIKVRARDVEFSILSNGNVVGLYLFIPGYVEGKRGVYGQIGYLFLDEALGEYDGEKKVGLIKFFPFNSHPDVKRYPLTELASNFDKVFATLPKPASE